MCVFESYTERGAQWLKVLSVKTVENNGFLFLAPFHTEKKNQQNKKVINNTERFQYANITQEIVERMPKANRGLGKILGTNTNISDFTNPHKKGRQSKRKFTKV